MYKLIAIDLDGTLLNDEKEIPKENIKTINKLMKRGYEVVFATGRRYMSAKSFIDDFTEDILVFANNGNIIRHSSNDKLELAHYLKSDTIDEILQKGKSLNLHPIIHVDRFDEGIDMIVENPSNHPVYSGYLNGEDRYKITDEFDNKSLSKILSIVYVGKIKELQRLKKYANKYYPNDYITYLMTNVHLAESLLEICNPDISKWISIKEYAAKNGIKPKQIIAIGDDTNDMDMIQNAGIGIAMKNAVKSVKQAADIVTDKDNNDAGLSEALRDIFKI